MSAKAGHTLLELIISILCIPILVSLSLPINNYLQKYKLNLATNELYRNLIYQRQISLASNTKRTLKLEKYSYSAENQKINLEKGVYLGSDAGIARSPSDKPVEGISTFKKDTVIFYPDGIISSGTVFLTNGQNTNAITCPISQVSCVRKYRYSSGKWTTY